MRSSSKSHLKIFWWAALLLGFHFAREGSCLNPEDVREGPCRNPHPQPATNIDFRWLESWPRFYFPAGSKYMLYKIASGNPDFANMNEYNFYYDFCMQGTYNFSSGDLQSFGFGGNPIGAWKMNVLAPGVINYVAQAQPPLPFSGQNLLGVMTLTDNKSFVFLYKCWLDTNQKGWDVFTTGPNVITPQVEDQIKRHAESLGFDRRQFQFLRYGDCQSRPEYGSGRVGIVG